MEIAQDLLELIQAFACLVSEKALPDFVPALLRDLALATALFYLVEPCVHWGVLLRVAKKTRRVLPRVEGGFKVKFLGFECVEHGGRLGSVLRGNTAGVKICRGILSSFHHSFDSAHSYVRLGERLTAEVWIDNKGRFLGPIEVCHFEGNIWALGVCSQGGGGRVRGRDPSTRVLVTLVG